VREQGGKGIVTSQGAAALALARDFSAHLITLDLHLPDMDGWRVIARLKSDVSTRHIPVCVISTEESRTRAFDEAAMSFISKPVQSRDVLDAGLKTLLDTVNRSTKHVVIGAPTDAVARDIASAIQSTDVEVEIITNPSAFTEAVAGADVDCAIVADGFDADLGDANARIEGQRPHSRLPVILYGRDERAQVPGFQALTLRRVSSRERLVDITALFLHQRVTRLPTAQHDIIETLHRTDDVLSGKKALVVDDDVRNVYALATVLEDYGIKVLSANSGREALKILQNGEVEIDIVLMDIMMPEMDGISVIREARKLPSCRDLPIIAVTAKAMKGDRERCIEAGAWDYLSKPVDPQQLLSVLRSWLHC
jgi:CheY-like chemotaxis protein